MSDEALIRLANLRSLKQTPVQLSERVGNRYTYWRDLLAGKKSFGEKIARKIEEKLELPRGWLDEVSPTVPGHYPNLPRPPLVASDNVRDASNMRHAPPKVSATAMELAEMFDMLPQDRILREQVRNEVSQAILQRIKESKPTPPVALKPNRGAA